MKKFYFLLLALCFITSTQAQIINFPDANFKAKLLQDGVDTNSDGEIDQSEAQNYSMPIFVNNLNIVSLSGIEYFTNAFGLDCSNNQITNLDVSNLGEIRFLRCSNNQLTSLTVSNLNFLNEIDCKNNLLTNFAISNLPGLSFLYCDNNQFSNLTIDNFPTLGHLSCNNSQLVSISVSNCPVLFYLNARVNFISNVNLTNLPQLEELDLGSNQLMTLDVSNLIGLGILKCYDNLPLSSLFIKNGSNQQVMLHACPNLVYICADESEILDLYSFSMIPASCTINSYCSFVPGGTFYSVSGNTRFDISSDGCDVSDINFPSLRFSISSGTTTGSIVSNNSGNYFIPVQSGTHTITPVLENPTYFSVSPSNVVVNFPTQASPFTQDFCVTANGVHPDLEVILTPMFPARPGFDAVYRLIYKNKGTNTQTGNINLSFNDAVLDFVSATPSIENQTANNLSWNFANLLPFETREITFTLNVNSPMETPAVNDGDQLDFSAVISPTVGDEVPFDNTFGLKQTVVNSYDPNDKTCLEGATISPSEVGKYVHYMIRFENNGTANAQNIVVKDMIDATKFDVSTLVPIKGSHSFVTRINGDKVEFIFENINLPFDDANNDGYVAFKIKTKPTLVTGNTFSNSASIYFDYNFPIVTNTTTTTIQALSNQDFAFGTYFTVYPNPVNNVLNIETKQTIEVSSVSIYNQLGQLVLVIPNAQNVSKVDVSNLATGNYFIKINSDKGTSNTKFIKQ